MYRKKLLIDQQNKMRFAAIVFSVLFLLAVTFFAFFETSEIKHDCIGDDCPVCTLIWQCRDMMRHLHVGNGALTIAVILMTVCVGMGELMERPFIPDTLVAKKVRMDA